MRHKLFISLQLVFVVLILAGAFIFYPRAEMNLNGNKVEFKSINANVVILSSSPDFSNPRYVDLNDSIAFNLKPGTYYWKVGNGILESFSDEFKIDSEVGLQILEKNGSYELKNVGDVKLNVTKTKDGRFVGHVILGPEEGESVENEGVYIGGQNG